MFLNKPSSQIINGGDKVVLECDVIGSPQPSITWTRDGHPLTENGRYKQSYDGRVSVLIISQSVVEDSGKYECMAINSSGKVSVDALIVVKGMPYIYRDRLIQMFRINNDLKIFLIKLKKIGDNKLVNKWNLKIEELSPL